MLDCRSLIARRRITASERAPPPAIRVTRIIVYGGAHHRRRAPFVHSLSLSLFALSLQFISFAHQQEQNERRMSAANAPIAKTVAILHKEKSVFQPLEQISPSTGLHAARDLLFGEIAAITYTLFVVGKISQV
jgi:hypothetical protein